MNNNCILAVSVPAKALLCFPHSHGIRRCCDGNEYKAIHIRLHADLNGRKFSFEMRYSVYYYKFTKFTFCFSFLYSLCYVR